MALLNKLIFDVRESLRTYSDDSEISNNYIIYLYNIKRAKYLRQELNNYQRTRDNSILQSFCLGLEEVSVNECSLDYDCGTILRTTRVIPKPLELHSKVALTRVKPTNRIAPSFNFIDKDKVSFISGAIFKSGVYAFLDDDNYIYVISPEGDDYKLLDCLSITGIFENPLDLATYSDCCTCSGEENPCYDELTTDYPLQPHFIDLIKKEIVSDLVQSYKIPEDTENDSIDKI